MALLIIGIVFFLGGAFLVYNYFSQKRRLEALVGVETSTTASLQEICQGVANDIGKGSFGQVAEVKGVIECEQPLESEIAKQPCVYYSMAVTRKWEEEYTEKNSQTGKMERKTRQGSDTVSSNTRSVPFKVRDDTGTILVNPKDAKIDGERVVDRFEPEASVSSGKVSFGKFSISLGGIGAAGGRRTLGYNFTETLLPLNRNVFVLGSASDSSGELMIQKPKEKKEQFLISLKSEEELLASAKSGTKWSLVGAIACFVVGVVFIILQLAR
jgi:hypothetical protein